MIDRCNAPSVSADRVGAEGWPMRDASRWDRWGLPLLMYYCSTLIVVTGTLLGYAGLDLCTRHRQAAATRLSAVDGMAAWDGQWYVGIAEGGYSYDRDRKSNVAFFPAYPLLGRALSWLSGLSSVWALLIVSHVSLAGSFVVLAAYVRRRFPRASRRVVLGTLLAFGLFPTTFFYRMAYTESLFVFLVLLAFYGMLRRWPAWSLVAIVGLATATRSLGIVLLAPLAMHLWSQPARGWRPMVRVAVVLPVAAWGLLLYIGYQWWAFDEPLAFVKTQTHWSMRPWPGNVADRLASLAALEPIVDVYDSECVCSWRRFPPQHVPTLNLMLANPIYFVIGGLLVSIGALKRWLSGMEWVFGALLLLVPYATHAYQTCMASQARYAAVAFPAYLVLGRLAAALPGSVVCCAALLSGLLLAAYAALFCNWYWFY